MNMLDQITRFEKLCANTFDKEKKAEGIALPKEIASALPMVEFGKRYLFANHESIADCRLLRNFLLWHLAKSKRRIGVIAHTNLFEQDFYALLELESGVEAVKIRAGFRWQNKEQAAVLEALERMREWKIDWWASLGAAEQTEVGIITISQEGWPPLDWDAEWEGQIPQCWRNNPNVIVLGFLEREAVKACRNMSFFYKESPEFHLFRADIFGLLRRGEKILDCRFEGGSPESGPCLELLIQDNTKLADASVDILLDELKNPVK